MSQLLNQGSPYFLSRHHALYQSESVNNSNNRHTGRFSFVDDVLDVEYSEYETTVKPEPVKRDRFRHVSRLAAGVLFRGLLFIRLVTYYVLHFRYRSA